MIKIIRDILNFINYILEIEHKDLIFYCYNFGKKDLFYILKVLTHYNKEHGETYLFKPIVRKDQIIYLEIKKDFNYHLKDKTIKRSRKLKIIDTTNYFNISLEKLAVEFGELSLPLMKFEDRLKSLLTIMILFNENIFKRFRYNATKSLTISRLSLDIFLRKFNSSRSIPAITQLNMYNFISQAYFGGITEVYEYVKVKRLKNPIEFKELKNYYIRILKLS